MKSEKRNYATENMRAITRCRLIEIDSAGEFDSYPRRKAAIDG